MTAVEPGEPLSPLPEGPLPADTDPVRRHGILHALRRGKGLAGVVLVALVVALGVLAPLLAPYSPTEQIRGANLLGPSAQHWFGTDEVNRDLLSRTLYGVRADLVVVFAAVPVGALLGVLIGLVTRLVDGDRRAGPAGVRPAPGLPRADPRHPDHRLPRAGSADGGRGDRDAGGPGLRPAGADLGAHRARDALRGGLPGRRRRPLVGAASSRAAELAGAADRASLAVSMSVAVFIEGAMSLPRARRTTAAPLARLPHQGRRAAAARRPVLRRGPAGRRGRAGPRSPAHLPVPRGGPSCLRFPRLPRPPSPRCSRSSTSPSPSPTRAPRSRTSRSSSNAGRSSPWWASPAPASR
ncbi:hypothetical protein [Nocardioides convexus]|uniref:hypothetical protein n=1 Tax=Nocardioides convexus TaxID=2712224 RepID=UPI00241838C0|nr:hypothetical protein [Nocardioides convexus]